VVGFTKALAKEVGSKGVTITSVGARLHRHTAFHDTFTTAAARPRT